MLMKLTPEFVFAKFWEVLKTHLTANQIKKVSGLGVGVRWSQQGYRVSALAGFGNGMLNWLGKVGLGKVL